MYVTRPKSVEDVTESSYCRVKGRRQSAQICGIAIMRAGETMENSLRAVVKDCKVRMRSTDLLTSGTSGSSVHRSFQMGKILIQTNDNTMEPELYYLRLPKDIDKYKVMLLDATVATGRLSHFLLIPCKHPIHISLSFWTQFVQHIRDDSVFAPAARASSLICVYIVHHEFYYQQEHFNRSLQRRFQH